jgi:hypothetical protein
LGVESWAQGFGDTQTPSGFNDGPHGADRATLGKLDLVEGTEGREVALELEGEFEGGNLLGVAMGEVGDVALADVRALAIGLAEVDGLVDLAVGRGPGGAGYVHDYIIRDIYR